LKTPAAAAAAAAAVSLAQRQLWLFPKTANILLLKPLLLLDLLTTS
jgi:hypothetical protein